LFSKFKVEFGNLVPISTKLFFKASEVDQELECEMHQTKYKVIIGCDMDLRPMTTTHIVRSCRRNGESREAYLNER
jgi:pyruvate carboxylase